MGREYVCTECKWSAREGTIDSRSPMERAIDHHIESDHHVERVGNVADFRVRGSRFHR
ncbi:hypothetical protein [Halalkalicoccus subterraneus]|uniref:hypothetical protein n=1 Tax=Halalkalicoccus subterraneus TaxID=2675002 RepID=UPI0013CE5017|nr:hypothetical protein [Halalkalicoccus subterraneus]